MTNQDDTKRQLGRGLMVHILYDQRPSPVSFEMLQGLLDAMNHPLSKHTLIKEIDFLCSEDLIRVFPASATDELTVVQQAKLLQRAAALEDVADTLFVRIRNRGVNLQEGRLDVLGVMRKR